MEESDVKQSVRQFYDQVGWKEVSDGVYQNARYEDLRPVAREYIHRCHLRVARHLKPRGVFLLDAGSGPVQYPEYLTYSKEYLFRVCADISIVALQEARKRLGSHGMYVVADVAHLPFKPEAFEGVVSLHTLHHLPAQDHPQAYNELYRVLQPGCQAVVVNGWTESKMMRSLHWMVNLMEWLLHSRRPAEREEKAQTGPTPPTSAPKTAGAKSAQPVGTFIQKIDADWLKQQLEGRIPYEIFCWRSVTVRFLRAVFHAPLGGRFLLRRLFALEEAFPAHFGKVGQYPLIVLKKPEESSDLPASATSVKIVLDESIAALNLLLTQLQGANVQDGKNAAAALWKKLFESEGYRRLKVRAGTQGKPDPDPEFIEFLTSPEVVSEAGLYRAGLLTWQNQDLTEAIQRAQSYLPRDTVLKAKIYPVIKPVSNNFTTDLETDPAIFICMDPQKTGVELTCQLAHELHHIGLVPHIKALKSSPDVLRMPWGVQLALDWMGSLGEGLAALAGVGAADVHPQSYNGRQASQEWEYGIGLFNQEFQQIQRFLLDVLAGRLQGEEALQVGRTFAGHQGGWAIIGWQMAVVIEKVKGKAALIEAFCDPRRLPITYNAAVEIYNQTAAHTLAAWSAEFLAALENLSIEEWRAKHGLDQ